MCVKGLTALLKKAQGIGDIHGVKVCRGASIISHLLFADDCFLFFRATSRECEVIKSVLNVYEVVSGRAINLSKSEVYFSNNVKREIQESVINILSVNEAMGARKYMGIPSLIGRKRRAVFGYLKDRVWKKINSRSSKSLSKAGREVLVKSVIQAIPAYCMSVFL